MNKKSKHSTDPEEKLLRESPAEASEDSQMTLSLKLKILLRIPTLKQTLKLLLN